MPAPRYVTLTPPPRSRRPAPDWLVLLAALLITSLAAGAAHWQYNRALDAWLAIEAARLAPLARPEAPR